MSKLFLKIREADTGLTWKTSLDYPGGILDFSKVIADLMLNLTIVKNKRNKKE